MPAILIVIAKPNEDCLDCFNRLTPQRYSIFQYSIDDLLYLHLDEDE
jgi:hypothetical protein